MIPRLKKQSGHRGDSFRDFRPSRIRRDGVRPEGPRDERAPVLRVRGVPHRGGCGLRGPGAEHDQALRQAVAGEQSVERQER